MSHYCQDHPAYAAKREPSGLCGRCWQLYFYKNPEADPVLRRDYQDWQADSREAESGEKKC